MTNWLPMAGVSGYYYASRLDHRERTHHFHGKYVQRTVVVTLQSNESEKWRFGVSSMEGIGGTSFVFLNYVSLPKLMLLIISISERGWS